MKLNDLFIQHEPPPHGLLKFNNLIEHEIRGDKVFLKPFGWSKWILSGAVCAILMTVILIFIYRPQQSNLLTLADRYESSLIYSRSGYAQASDDLFVSINEQSTIVISQQSSAHSNVRFYWVK